MPFQLPDLSRSLPLILPGLAAAGGVFSNRAEKSNQTSSQTTQLSPEQEALLKQLLAQQARLGEDVDLTGYESAGISDINRNRALQLQALQENMAYRGITGPALGNAEAGVDSSRFSDIIKLRQGIPLLRNQVRTDTLNSGMNLFNTFPRNTTTSSSGSTNSNKLGGGISNAASALAYLLGQGAFGNNVPASQPSAGTKSVTNSGTPKFNPYGGMSYEDLFSGRRTPSYH